MTEPTGDQRTAATLVRQYEVLSKIKRDLIRQGELTGAAKLPEIVAKLRELIPTDLWTAR